MPEQWEVESAGQLIRLSRFLLTKADSRGLTHGEKHYLIQTTLALLLDAQSKLHTPSGRGDYLNQVDSLNSVDIPSDIPF